MTYCRWDMGTTKAPLQTFALFVPVLVEVQGNYGQNVDIATNPNEKLYKE